MPRTRAYAEYASAFRQPGPPDSLDDPLEFLAERRMVGNPRSFLHQFLHREPGPHLQELRNRGGRLCLLAAPGVRGGEIDVQAV